MEKPTTRESLVEAMELARMSNPTAALVSLERGLKEARIARDSGAISLLAKNAGIISFNSGELDRALAYFEEALDREPRDAYLYLMVADVYKELGREDEAKQAISTCWELAKKNKDEELLSILQERSGSS
jgi:Flp pilus assembly protein TadD